MFSVCTWIEHNSEYFSGYNYQLNWFVSELYVLFMNIRIIWYHKGFSFCVTSHIFEHWSHICKPLLISHCIIKTKVLLPQAGDLNRFCRSCLGPSVYLLAKLFKLFGFPTFLFWAYLMKVIWSVPDEGYFERTWWRLFWASPDEGYLECTWRRLFGAYLTKVILSFTWWRLFGAYLTKVIWSVTWWRLFQKRVVRTQFDIYVLLQ